MRTPRPRNIFAVLKQAARRYADQDMSTYASALAFQAFFSIFPFLLFLVALLAFLDLPQFFDWLKLQARLFVPGQAVDQVTQVIDQIRAPNGTLLSFGVAAAWWAASGGVRSAMTALTVCCGARETRPAWKRILLSLVLTLVLAAMLVAAALLLTIGPNAARWLTAWIGLDQQMALLWSWLRLPIWLLLLALIIALIYWTAPDCRQRLSRLLPGALLALLTWVLASVGFGFYLSNFANYSALYGSIGTIIALLFYFSLSASVLLYGAQVNAVMAQNAASQPGTRS